MGKGETGSAASLLHIQHLGVPGDLLPAARGRRPGARTFCDCAVPVSPGPRRALPHAASEGLTLKGPFPGLLAGDAPRRGRKQQ